MSTRWEPPGDHQGITGGCSASHAAARDDNPPHPAQLIKMTTFLTVLVVFALLGTVGALGAGLFGLMSGRQDPARSNQLMQYRILFQGVAVALFVVLLMLMKS